MTPLMLAAMGGHKATLEARLLFQICKVAMHPVTVPMLVALLSKTAPFI